MRMFRAVAAVALAGSLLLPVRGQAEECRLTEVASIELAATPNGVPLVPVKLNGVDEQLRLDLEHPYSYLASDIGTEIGVPKTDVASPLGDFVPNGTPLRDIVFAGHIQARVVPTVQIGSLLGKNILMYSGPDRKSMNGTAGAIGLNFLSNYDVELDLSKNKLNLFDKNHCPGKVIYWTQNAAIGMIEIKPIVGGTNQYTFSLDGHPLGAFITADQMDTELAFPIAREEFNLTDKSNGVVLAKKDEWGYALYRFPFKILDADGLAISDPQIYLSGDPFMDKICDSRLHSRTLDNQPYNCRGDADLQIGVHELRALHLFFAFSEKKLYLTAASAN
jgi:hypothetical protein